MLLTFARDPATGALTGGAAGGRRPRRLHAVRSAVRGQRRRGLARRPNRHALGILPGSVGVFRRDPGTGALTEVQCLREGDPDLSARAFRERRGGSR